MSRIILNQPPNPKLPNSQDSVSIPCTRTITNFGINLDFAPGTEKYFEDSTTLTATLSYKSSTFILSYDKNANMLHLPNNQMNLQDGQYSLNLFAANCMPAGMSCTNCIINYTFYVAYSNVLLFVDIVPAPDPPVLSCHPGNTVDLQGTQIPTPAFKAQWAWLVNNQFEDIPGATASLYKSSQAGTYRYTLTGPSGCSGSNIIGVSPPELPGLEIQPDTQILNACSQKIVGVSVQNAGGAGNITYDWTPGNNGILVSGETTISPLIGAPGAYNLVVTRNDNGCTAGATVVAKAGNIPVVSAQISREPATGRLDCRLKEIKLLATAGQSPGSSPFVFNWSDGRSGSEIIVTNPGIYSVTATATNNGCQGAAGLLVNQDISKPLIQIMSPRDTICTDENITLTALTQEPVTYLWDNNSTNSTNNVSPGINGPTNYAVTITAADNGCTNSAEKEIVQVDAPQVFCQETAYTVTNGEGASLDCSTSGDRLTWLATSTNVRNIPASGNGPVVGQIFQLDNVQTPGKVAYALYGINTGCTSERADVTVSVLPVTPDGIFIPELITPNGDGLNDTWDILLPETVGNPEAYTIRLFNRYGAQVYESTLANSFDATTYPDGTYYYLVSVPDGNSIRGAVTILRRR